MISSKHLALALYKLSHEGMATPKIMPAFFAYVEKYHLTSLLPATLKYLEKFQKQDEVFNTLEIVSGLPVADEVVREIGALLKTGAQDTVQYTVDKELIGGFTATYQGFIYDASIKNQIHLLKTRLIGN